MAGSCNGGSPDRLCDKTPKRPTENKYLYLTLANSHLMQATMPDLRGF